MAAMPEMWNHHDMIVKEARMAKPLSKYELKLVCGHDSHAEVVSEVIKNIGCMRTLLASEKS